MNELLVNNNLPIHLLFVYHFLIINNLHSVRVMLSLGNTLASGLHATSGSAITLKYLHQQFIIIRIIRHDVLLQPLSIYSYQRSMHSKYHSYLAQLNQWAGHRHRIFSSSSFHRLKRLSFLLRFSFEWASVPHFL